jgi:hypothetical protein
MRQKVMMPVNSFPVAVTIDEAANFASPKARKYDVCIVGSGSARRSRLIEKLRRSGLHLSPISGANVEDVASQSKILLNVHLQRCNHLEYPRILSAFATKAALVTEYCLGMENYFPPETYICADYNELPERIEALLADPAKLEQMGEAAYSWISNTHLRNFELEWKKRIDEIHDHFYTRTVNHGSAVSKGTTADPGSCQMDHTDSTIMQG